MDSEVFKHLPRLQGRIVPPDESALRATPEALVLWDERARLRGFGPNWRLSDAELEGSRLRFLEQFDHGEDIWIFGYGSLMWDPAFRFEEVRLAGIKGFKRRFSLRSEIGRGSPESPALMLTLEPGEVDCVGLAFRLAAAASDYETGIVWRREMIRGSYKPLKAHATTPQGPVQALVFGPNPASPAYVGELPLDETAGYIATGAGYLGTNLGYLEELVARLEELEIEDDYVRSLLLAVRKRGSA